MVKEKNFQTEKYVSGLYIVFVVLFSATILFVSISRASLDIWASENNFDKARNCPIEFIIKADAHGIEKGSYNLPSISVLPGSPLYILKDIRDELWIGFSTGPESKATTALLVADKKMSASKSLFEDNKGDKAVELAREALEYIKRAKSEWQKASNDEPQMCSPIDNKIFNAGLAYEEVLKTSGKKAAGDKNEFREVLLQIQEWNEKQKEEKEN
ncbi:MAG: DUF5667 domain-containing protein [Patescibacteria group bacterium]